MFHHHQVVMVSYFLVGFWIEVSTYHFYFCRLILPLWSPTDPKKTRRNSQLVFQKKLLERVKVRQGLKRTDSVSRTIGPRRLRHKNVKFTIVKSRTITTLGFHKKLHDYHSGVWQTPNDTSSAPREKLTRLARNVSVLPDRYASN